MILSSALILTLTTDRVSGQTNPPLNEVTYTATNEAFPNPERGFYKFLVNSITWPTKYSGVRDLGYSIARLFIQLDPYINSDLPQSFLDELTSEFALARSAGVKIIVDTSYNFGYINGDINQLSDMASLSQILRHISQSKPILQANEDVIMAQEAGYIGAWGEWHQGNTIGDFDYISRGAVLNAMLDALPTSRMILLRYPRDLYYLHGTPTTYEEAYNGTNRARVGFYNLGVNSSLDGWTTFSYWGIPGYSVDENKAFVAANSLYTLTGGETDVLDPSYPSCATALPELQSMHYSYLDMDWNPSVYSIWQTQGCFDEINRRLGYRFELLNAYYTTSIQPGGNFHLQLNLRNTGYAAMFNARPVYAVLQNGSNKYTFPVSADPRRWAAGADVSISQDWQLPADMSAGNYTLNLWLPDAADSIKNNPLYAVRFANLNTWDVDNGYNILASNISIADNVPPAAPTGVKVL